ncbi:MAG: marine proteobacterial sortase target protein [Spirochaetales bacterium]|nr:marine proteobacterial sortase target protein [Spirochaetales bacterium]
MIKLRWLLITFLVVFTIQIQAEEKLDPYDYVTGLSEINTSSMVFYLEDSQKYMKAPDLDMKATIYINGIIAKIKFTQVFSNPYDKWLEGTYVFPLSETAAVIKLRMTVGEKVIEGIIMEKKEAKKTYEEAKANGKKAALLEQDRPNIFTTQVANIPPGEKITVEFEYQDVIEPEDGEYSLRFPLVITPRYDPDAREEYGLLVNSRNISEQMGNDNHIPVRFNLAPFLGGGKGKRNNIDISVELNAGFPLRSIVSLYHGVHVAMRSSDSCVLALASGTVPADRDFVLRWNPEPGTEPEVSLLMENDKTSQYGLVMIQPPGIESVGIARIPRETVFIIDTSGSMEGSSIVQAKEALLAALKNMADTDMFNIIAFNSTYKTLFNECRIKDSVNYTQALLFVANLQADGGTEMKPVLEYVFSLNRDRSRLGQVIFITDGAVSNESELFTLIKRNLDDRRLFTIGIGSAPNSYFMRKAAAAGRGTFTYIGDVDEVEDTMKRLFVKISSPLMRNINIIWEGNAGEIWPGTLPDLYAGQPVCILSKLSGAGGQLIVKGEYGGKIWTKKIALGKGNADRGIGMLWARKKIDVLLDQAVEGISDDVIRMQVLPIALEYKLMSPYTSFVAVEHVISKPAAENIESGEVPLNPPDGWEPSEPLLKLAATATNGELHLLLGGLLVLLALLTFGILKLGR